MARVLSRRASSLHRSGGLSDPAIVRAVGAGLRRAAVERPGCAFRQIITCLRDFGPEEALVMTKLAVASPEADHGGCRTNVCRMAAPRCHGPFQASRARNRTKAF